VASSSLIPWAWLAVSALSAPGSKPVRCTSEVPAISRRRHPSVLEDASASTEGHNTVA
jgi:hypothetical protein